MRDLSQMKFLIVFFPFVVVFYSGCQNVENINVDDQMAILGGGSRMDSKYNYSFEILDDRVICKRWEHMNESTKDSTVGNGPSAPLVAIAEKLLRNVDRVQPPFYPGFLPPYIILSDGRTVHFSPENDNSKKSIDLLEAYTNEMKACFKLE